MAIDTKKQQIRPVRPRSYLAKDFQQFKNQFIEYSKTFFPNSVKDLSENSFGGMITELLAGVGDNLSFYLDHQFTELDPELAVENSNIERGLRSAGVSIVGAAPSVVNTTVYIEVPAVLTSTGYVPDTIALPIVQENSVFTSDNGTQFTLIEKIDFTELDKKGKLKATIAIGDATQSGTPLTFVLSREGQCISGKYTEEQFSIGNSFVPFREISLSNPNITEILSVKDTLGNTYYKVNSLTQDVVFKTIPNGSNDSDIIQDSLEIIPAPYRFTEKADLGSRLSTLTFGGGNANSLADDVIPDITDFAIPLYGKKTFSRLVINPDTLFETNTMGIATVNTTITITYRYGGGINHNIEPNTLRTITALLMKFPNNPTAAIAQSVRSSTEITNKSKAVGGSDAPTVEELKALIQPSRNAQSRIVSKSDLLAFIYQMPSNLGRVFRASVQPNANNPLATELFILSRDGNGNLVASSDTLKKNLATFLNSYRLISDGIDVLDGRIINFKMNFEIVSDPSIGNKTLLIQNIISKLKKYFDIKNWQLGQPIVLGDIQNIIFNIPGVVSITKIEFVNLSGKVNNIFYSNEIFDFIRNTKKGFVLPGINGIFELKIPEENIIGAAL